MPESFQQAVESRFAALPSVGLATGIEQARRKLQIGTVPGASKALANVKPLVKVARIIDGAVQLGKTAYLVGKEGARDGHAEAGEALTKKSLPRQVVETILDPAFTMSKYGAYKEKLDKKAFEESLKKEPTANWVAEQKQKQNYGKRPDGTDKGPGYLGALKLPDGNVATEYTTQSDAVKFKGKRIDFPTLVPTLSKEEVSALQNDIIPNKKDIPEPIMRKAIDHANARLQKGLSVFK
jgi:hypothetical protein